MSALPIVVVKKRGKNVAVRVARGQSWVKLKPGKPVELKGLVVTISHKNGKTLLHRYFKGKQLSPTNIGDGTHIVGVKEVQKL